MNTDRDIIVFTMHKSASMFLHSLCKHLTRASGIDYHSPNTGGSRADPRLMLTQEAFWQERHGCFAPVRFFTRQPDLDRYNILLHLRDPRDVLVSMFYSYCYIHGGSVSGNQGYRKDVAGQGIDKFVLEKANEGFESNHVGDYGTGGHLQDIAGGITQRYRDYIDNLVGRANVTLLRYESMVTDFASWLDLFLGPFPLPNRNETREMLLAREAQFFPRRSSDVMQHVRHVMPGDHRNKLLPETIETLNSLLADVLKPLGYATGKMQ